MFLEILKMILYAPFHEVVFYNIRIYSDEYRVKENLGVPSNNIDMHCILVI